MKERPIIFTGQMVRAILEGRKTMTRRVIKPQPQEEYSNAKWYPDRYNKTSNWCFWGRRDTPIHNKCGLPLFKCPYGDIGDHLWIKETWAKTKKYEFKKSITKKGIAYRADFTGLGYVGIKWKSPLFMPKNNSRILIEITNVKVERVQDISEEDAKAEGAQSLCRDYIGDYLWTMEGSEDPKQCLNSARLAFANYLNKIHGGKNWNFYYNGNLPDEKQPIFDKNPWVWVIEFKRIN